ncbi:acidic mammalian chitinase-like [Oppia nitens]|uniref:acidic mammalian chitinase-like n=1 Tax=Oppia nitens TaxID=1686743 RepID=UPI0023DC8807|nr:acidic mammalian chitinase-like [Oppia nitens]
MFMKNVLMKTLLFILIIIINLIQINCKFKTVCYLRVDESQRIDVQTINGTLCTHIILAFAVLNNGIIVPKEVDDIFYYQNVTTLKTKYNDLKVMLSIGGGGSDGSGFHEICSNQTNIDRFVWSVLDFLLKYNLDGLDLDWEFPAWNTPFPNDKYKFTQLLKTLHLWFGRQQNRIDRRHDLLLSCAVSAIVNVVDGAYDMPDMAQYIDFVNVMSYDFHIYSKYWPFTGYNSPLFNRKVEKSYFSLLNTNRSINYWVDLGMSKDKIMVGIPTYGHTYVLANTDHTTPDSAAIQQLDDISYPSVCQMMRNSSSKVIFDVESKVPYLVNDNHWISYDDEISVAFKAQWIRDNGFAGAMTYDLNNDDFNYICNNETKFPLHSIIYSIIN